MTTSLGLGGPHCREGPTTVHLTRSSRLHRLNLLSQPAQVSAASGAASAGRPFSKPWRSGRRRLRPGPVPAGAGARSRTRCPRGRGRPDILQEPARRHEQGGATGDQLDLPLPPSHLVRTVLRCWRGRRHGVVTDLGQHPAVDVQQPVHAAAGPYGRHRLERAVPAVRPHHRAQRFRHGARRPPQRDAQLVTVTVTVGQLQMPACVVAPGAAAHGDPSGGQGKLGGVEVGRVQLHLDRRVNGGHTGEPVQPGQLRLIVGLELVLDLPMHRHHPPGSTIRR